MDDVLRVVGAVIENNGRILACRRRAEKAEGGKWEFPGGKVEANESPEQALMRELSEELELHDARVLELVDRTTTESNGNSIDLACYRVETATRPIPGADHDSITWCTGDQLTSLDWALADWPTVHSLMSTNARSQRCFERSPRAER